MMPGTRRGQTPRQVNGIVRTVSVPAARWGSGLGEWRDLNRNGRLDPYEDAAAPIDVRVYDLLGQMTLAEKAGQMMHTIAPLDGGIPGLTPAVDLIAEKVMNHFNVMGSLPPGRMAVWHNELQAAAEQTRLGIPVTVSTDPRHGASDNPATAMVGEGFSRWPEPLGLAATRDPKLVQAFADIARQEYRAVGISVALHPMADLATEPRWARIGGTFGEDADLAAEMVGAYIRGFQGESLGRKSVACMTKHFPGGGPQKDGEDPHFPYGREQIYPGDNAAYHLRPFEAAFAAGTAQIMPYYGMPVGLDWEEVGFGFNRDVITGMLRGRYGFDGVVCADWGLLTDSHIFGKVLPARAWGVEHLDLAARARKAIEAGIDQFGAEECPEIIVALVESGQVPEERIDESVRRLLRDKFRLGLFDEPFVDPAAAESIVGNAEFQAAGEAVQRRSIVLLRNRTSDGQSILPLAGSPRIYVENLAREAVAGYGEVVLDPSEADVAILRLAAPYEARDTYPLEAYFHAGDLRFPDDELGRILAIMETVPTVIDIYLDRPAVIPEIASRSAALLASFGADDAALLDVVFGRCHPTGSLPFELPSTMEAVRGQLPDVPYDSADPLFAFGHGLTY